MEQLHSPPSKTENETVPSKFQIRKEQIQISTEKPQCVSIRKIIINHNDFVALLAPPACDKMAGCHILTPVS
jgi:hypothetical protein